MDNVNLTVVLAAMVFALFALVTLLLGDIADLKGDMLAGVRTLPVLVGPEKTLRIILSIPITLAVVSLTLYPLTGLNIVFPIMITLLCTYSFISMVKLRGRCGDVALCRRVKSKMRLMHIALQLSFLAGLLPPQLIK